MSPACDRGDRAQILDPAVGAAADEDAIDRQPGDRLARGQPHISERAFLRGAVERVGGGARIGDMVVDRDDLRRVGAPGDHRAQHVRRNGHLAIEARVGGACERAPLGDVAIPVCAPRRAGAALEIGEAGLVGRDQRGARAHFDREVAQGHPSFHRQRRDRRAGEFDDMPQCAVDPDRGEDAEREILGRKMCRQRAGHGKPHRPGFAQPQRLRREHMFDLRGADAEGERAERAVGRGVAVAADDRHPRPGTPLLGGDDMDDAVARIAHLEPLDPVAFAILDQPGELRARLRIGDRGDAVGLRDGGDIMVEQRQRPPRLPHPASARLEPGKGLRRGDFVEQMEVDVEQGFAPVVEDAVAIPDAIEQRAGHTIPRRLRSAIVASS